MSSSQMLFITQHPHPTHTPGQAAIKVALFALVVVSGILEKSNIPPFSRKGSTTSGLTLGILTVPWVCCAVLGGEHTSEAVHRSIAVAWSCLALVTLHGSPIAGLLMVVAVMQIYGLYSFICTCLFALLIGAFLPQTCSLGEAVVLTQGLVFLLHADTVISAILLRSVIIACSTMLIFKFVGKLAGAMTLVALLAHRLVPLLMETVDVSTPQNRWIVAYWSLLLLISLPLMKSISSHTKVFVRKGYHILAALLFLPAYFLGYGEFLSTALAVACSTFVVVEVIRLSDLPGISKTLNTFMGSFIDERDGGVIFITHFTLLLGMALPVWLGPHSSLPSLSGILIIGFGDTAASVIGTIWGRSKICYDGEKTAEGTLAGMVTTLVALAVLLPGKISLSLVAATVVSSGLEACTEQLDNLFIPLHYFTLIMCCCNKE